MSNIVLTLDEYADFHDQSEMMKITVLHASIGEVALSTSRLEMYADLALDLMGQKVEIERPTLGLLVKKLIELPNFNSYDSQVLQAAVKLRNRFAHHLPSIYLGHVDDDKGTMLSLIQEMNQIKVQLDAATEILDREVQAVCNNNQFDIDTELRQQAAKQYEWLISK
ncbi:hypothetical protein [Vibrio harveyi]